MSTSRLHWVLGLALVSAALAGSCKRTVAPACRETATALYERRIAPILRDDRPTTCNECHLSGVDLSLFVRDTPCETMACLVERQLVDLDNPDRSLVLSWIRRADPASGLITQAVIDEEHAAFLEWIEYSATCGESACAGVTCGGGDSEEPFCPSAREPAEGTTPEMVDRGGCTDRDLELLFRDTFYAARGRCYPCHFDSVPDRVTDAPRWVSTQLTCENASLETMHNVVNGGYLDLEDPERSLILLKPLPEDQGGVVHGGHDKITKDDLIYANLLYWIERYADCRLLRAGDGGTDVDAAR